ncbi:hypothetical protein [Nocardia cyriacigeorgica]|uniref:hypothetical protein n=1 Tax=Nocardia cyriacigeorgica TaxID=135487 RepID=UPI00245663EE|nr:hypothetical protein [Nocardia cyriacigeorgica]
MTIQPPSGAEDLVAQAEQLARERAEFEAERAALLAAREQRDTEPAAVPVAASEPEYELDADGEPYLDDDGNPYPKGKFEVGDDGLLLFDGTGKPYPKWTHDTVEYKGHTFQIRAAEPAAISAFSMMSNSSLDENTQVKLYRKFVDSHMSVLSQTRIFELMMDGELDVSDYQELFKIIAKNGTARPTGPSRR